MQISISTSTPNPILYQLCKMKIVTVPNPVLYEPCKIIEQPMDRDMLENLSKSMLELMEQSHGVGLAAPQVGLSLNLFVASKTGKAQDGKLYINPLLSVDPNESFFPEHLGEEGCLSIPGVILPIKRYKNVSISYQKTDGSIVTEKSDDRLARIWQHEFDHLQGILITHRYKRQNPEWEDCYDFSRVS